MNAGTGFAILKYTSALSVLVPFIFCFVRLKALDFISRALFFYLSLSVLMEGTSFLLISNHNRTSAISHIYTIAEFSIFIAVYWRVFTSKNTRVFLSYSYILFLALAVYILGFGSGLIKPDNILTSYEASVLIVLSGFYFYKVMQDLDIPKLQDHPFFWINSAVLIYFCVGFFLFLFSGYITWRGLETYHNFYSLLWISNMAFHILIAMGIWKIRAS